MILIPNLPSKQPSQTEPGELIAFALRRHRAIGLVLANEQNRTLIGLLQSSEKGLDLAPPFAFHLDHRSYGNNECLSFGRDWVLELLPGDESIPGRVSEWANSGAVYLHSDGARIFFKGIESTSFSSGYTFNLDSSELVTDDDRGTPHLAWRIWGSEADRDHNSRQPIMSFQGIAKDG